MGKSNMFKENIINHPFWTILQMPIYKEYLNHTLGLTLSTPGLVYSLFHQIKLYNFTYLYTLLGNNIIMQIFYESSTYFSNLKVKYDICLFLYILMSNHLI